MQLGYKDFLLQEPDKRLHEMCKAVFSLAEARMIAGKLIEAIKRVDGSLKPWLGMAAPQVGFNKRVIVLKEAKDKYIVMINPEIIEQKWNLPIFSRCFSIDGIYIIRSPYWIKLKYQDLDGKYHQKIVIGGKAATVTQEINHINGMLISNIGMRII